MNTRDMQQNYWVHRSTQGFQEFTLLYNDASGPKPWFTDQNMYGFLTVIQLSWLQKLSLLSHSRRADFHISKHIYA
jgi:hypothetical protein